MIDPGGARRASTSNCHSACEGTQIAEVEGQGADGVRSALEQVEPYRRMARYSGWDQHLLAAMGIWSFWELVPSMRCSACTTDNPAGARFCHQCGAALQSLCSACGTELIPNARFCSHCGAALQADATPSAAPTNSEPLSFQAEVSGGI